MKSFALTAVSLACLAQSFEVASIRLHKDDALQIGRSVNGSLVTIDAMTVANLLATAFDLRSFQIEGGPSWMKSDRYDISARGPAEAKPTDAEVDRMLQALLADRFHLQFHRSTRETAVYALVQAKSGTKLKLNADGPGRVLIKSPGRDTPTELIGDGASLELLLGNLSVIPGIDRPVLDRTGLTGKYDFQLTTILDRATGIVTGPSGESIFTAVEEQLGLRLEQQRLPVETLVVDRLDRPSEN